MTHTEQRNWHLRQAQISLRLAEEAAQANRPADALKHADAARHHRWMADAHAARLDVRV